MNIQSVNNNQSKPAFKGIMGTIARKPAIVAALAGSSVVAQKIVMSGSEAVVGPAIDIGVGKAITKATNEKNGKTNENSKAQAIRTFSQSVGGTIVGVAVRLLAIGAMTALFTKAGEKAGKKIGMEAKKTEGLFKKMADAIVGDEKLNAYEYSNKMAAWGKSAGGAVAIVAMIFTNFLIDAPFINKINGKATEIVDNFSKNRQNAKQNKQEKEIK